ncbi:hypothetical protein Y032_0607g590 [Ancylostoma ceylanicum]|uniref:Uncharacterized protein n=1 Tax=Ancylostoma ceylanicum TaxID=53326 RepID=A0A016WNJ3_9BILA|nr:hypothetical protein Y032_0607g590 [Ancylostoma ceylanicum]
MRNLVVPPLVVEVRSDTRRVNLSFEDQCGGGKNRRFVKKGAHFQLLIKIYSRNDLQRALIMYDAAVEKTSSNSAQISQLKNMGFIIQHH